MKTEKKFFFTKEDKAVISIDKIDKKQMKSIVGGMIAYDEIRPTYAESTYVRH